MLIGEFEVMDIIRIVGAAATCFMAYFIVGYATGKIVGFVSNRLPQSTEDVLAFFLKYTLFIITVGIILNVSGFNITTLLGAAGVFGVAIGFASQTTIANVISGIFLMIEHSLRVGDVIKYDDAQGKIQDIGLLSVMLKTIDNKLIRVPNELLIKNKVVNITALKQRVIVFHASVSTKDDADKAIRVFQDAWQQMDLAIKDKEISVSYAASSADTLGFSINIWVKTSDIIAAKSEYIKLCSTVARAQGVPLYITSQ